MPHFGQMLIDFSKELKSCKSCNNISKNEICSICEDEKRDETQICVVETLNELMNFEKARLKCKYFILGEDFFDQVLKNEIFIKPLISRIQNLKLEEVIIALNTTIAGQTNLFFLDEVIKKQRPELKITTLSRGIPVGTQIDYIDEITIKQAFDARTEI